MEEHIDRGRGKRMNMASSARQKRVRKLKCDKGGTS